jgi:predicted FMN-binding regulatory protein PaiB
MIFDSSGINLNSVYDNSSSVMLEDIHKNTHEETLENLRKEGNLVNTFKNNTTGWILVHIIVGFEIKIKTVEGKWKLNQNHTVQRQQNLINGLKTRNESNSQEIAKLMEQNILSEIKS